MKFAPTDFAQKVAVLYRTGFQKGVSVGFKPLRYEERRHEKTGASLEQELLETSAVPVPANRNALTRALEQAPLVGSTCAGSMPSNMRPEAHRMTRILPTVVGLNWYGRS